MHDGKQKVTTGLVAFALLAGGASGLRAWEDEFIPCAESISSSEQDDPITANLIGTSDVTLSVSGGGRVGADFELVDVSAGADIERTIEYQIGYYRTSEGELIVIDCRTYEQLN